MDGLFLPMNGLFEGFSDLTNGIFKPTNEYGESEKIPAFVRILFGAVLIVVLRSPVSPRFSRTG
jgi:hypothetical protein